MREAGRPTSLISLTESVGREEKPTPARRAMLGKKGGGKGTRVDAKVGGTKEDLDAPDRDRPSERHATHPSDSV